VNVVYIIFIHIFANVQTIHKQKEINKRLKMAKRKIMYVEGERISTYKKICKFLFAASFIAIKVNKEELTFTVMLRDTAREELVQKFADYWRGLEIIIISSNGESEGSRVFKRNKIEEETDKINVKELLKEEEDIPTEENTDEELDRLLKGE